MKKNNLNMLKTGIIGHKTGLSNINLDLIYRNLKGRSWLDQIVFKRYVL